MKSLTVSRREFMQWTAAAAAGISLFPGKALGMANLPAPMKRSFGKTGFQVTTLGMGGQASLQWTPDDVDPVSIILKAFKLGINYYDTSNLYLDSQLNYGKAFRQLNLIPGKEGFDEKLRESIFLTSKTHIRWAKGGFEEVEGVGNWTQGDHGEGAVADLKRSLSQIFGDGSGWYPEGSYLNMVLMHSINNSSDVDILYKGLETELDPEGNFGTLVVMRDFRDGTNLTGLNPKKEKLIRHIGFSGHLNSPAMMEMIRRDSFGILDGMLVAINPNDKRYLNHQYNVIPVAQARNMAIIGMKAFADGAIYGKEARWSQTPEDVIRTVGSPDIPSRPLVEYALGTPGIQTLIIGTGQVSEDNMECQLVQNFYAAQVEPKCMNQEEREKLEEKLGKFYEGKTNYFQKENGGLTPPQNLKLLPGDSSELTWDTAIADQAPLSHYEIFREEEWIASVAHHPQTSMEPFRYTDTKKGGYYQVIAVDKRGIKSPNAKA